MNRPEVASKAVSVMNIISKCRSDKTERGYKNDRSANTNLLCENLSREKQGIMFFVGADGPMHKRCAWYKLVHTDKKPM